MTLTVECAKEFEGRWLAEVPQLPGVYAYGATRDAATEQALSMVYHVLENERRHGVQRADAAEVYGRQSERRLNVIAPDLIAS
jgi:predicted RNase H-like HicB family nuclease